MGAEREREPIDDGERERICVCGRWGEAIIDHSSTTEASKQLPAARSAESVRAAESVAARELSIESGSGTEVRDQPHLQSGESHSAFVYGQYSSPGLSHLATNNDVAYATGRIAPVRTSRGRCRGRISTTVAYVFHVTGRHRRRLQLTPVVVLPFPRCRLLPLSSSSLLYIPGSCVTFTLALGSYLTARIVLSSPSPACAPTPRTQLNDSLSPSVVPTIVLTIPPLLSSPYSQSAHAFPIAPAYLAPQKLSVAFIRHSLGPLYVHDCLFGTPQLYLRRVDLHGNRHDDAIRGRRWFGVPPHTPSPLSSVPSTAISRFSSLSRYITISELF